MPVTYNSIVSTPKSPEIRRGRRPKGGGPGPDWEPVTQFEVRQGYWSNHGWRVVASLSASVFSVWLAFALWPLTLFPLFAALLVCTTFTGLLLPLLWYRRHLRMALAAGGDLDELTQLEGRCEATNGFFRHHARGLVAAGIVGTLACTVLTMIVVSAPAKQAMIQIGLMKGLFEFYLVLLVFSALISAALPLKWWRTHRRSSLVADASDEFLNVELTGFSTEPDDKVSRADVRAARPHRGL